MNSLVQMASTMPTVPPINVEVAAPAPSMASTAVIAAIIGATAVLIGQFVAHVATRGREHEKWVRERLFDTIKVLDDEHRAFEEACVVRPSILPYEPMSVGEVKTFLREHDWTAMNRASKSYLIALRDIGMLVPGTEFSKRLQSLRSAINSAETKVQDPFWNELPTHITNNDEYYLRSAPDLRLIRKLHLSVIGHITYKFFTTHKGRVDEWQEHQASRSRQWLYESPLSPIRWWARLRRGNGRP